MISRRLLIALLLTVPSFALAAEEPITPTAREILKARLAEDAKNAPAAPAATAPGTTTSTAPGTSNGSTTATTAPGAGVKAPAPPAETSPILATTPPATTDTPSTQPKPGAQPATVMPQVEVRKRRITELDRQLAQQDQEIAREKKNTKPSEVDKALNDSKIAKPLAIFGGESTQFRKRVANERVNLMEDEKDIIEAIAQAKTKEEKAELQKQLEAIRAERRELEKALR